MKTSDEPMTLGRGLLAGLFTGLITAVIIMVFNVIYRGKLELYNYNIVMPFAIFTFFPLFNLTAGGVYFLFATHLRRGHLLFSLTAILVMVVVVLITAFTGEKASHEYGEFRGLLVGLELIEGIMAAFMIPFFANHPTLFLTDKDIRGEE